MHSNMHVCTNIPDVCMCGPWPLVRCFRDDIFAMEDYGVSNCVSVCVCVCTSGLFLGCRGNGMIEPCAKRD